MIEVEKVEPSGLFTNYIFKAIPLAFDESMSYYETLCGLLNYMKNTMIPALNNNADAMIELQNLMVQLQDYVDNYFNNEFPEMLDEKLDELVENGTIANILNNYANITKSFDTVNDMINDTTLVIGQKVKTLGYYNVNDGGSGLYIIRELEEEETADEYNILTISDNIVAELLSNDIKNIAMYGIIGDNTHDYTTRLNHVLSMGSNVTYYVPEGIYLISDTIEMDSNNNLQINNNATFKATAIIDTLFIYNQNRPNGLAVNNYISGGIFDGDDKVNVGIQLGNYSSLRLENVKIHNVTEKGLICKYNESTAQNDLLCKNLYVRNFENSYANSVGIVANCNDSSFYNGNIVDFETAIQCTSSNSFYNIHPWLHFTNIYENSCFCNFSGNAYAIFDNCISDSIRTVFKITGSKLRCNNMRIYTSPTFITESIQTSYPMKFIDNNTGSGVVNISNVSAYTEYGANIICTKMDTRNKFYNCIFESNNGTWDETNFNNSSDVSYELGNVYTQNNINFNNVDDTKIYRMLNLSTATNNPSTNSGILENFTTGADFNNNFTKLQRYTEFTSGDTYQRSYNGTTWSDWIKNPTVKPLTLTNLATNTTITLNSSHKIGNVKFIAIDFTLGSDVTQFGNIFNINDTIGANTRAIGYQVSNNNPIQFQIYSNGNIITNTALTSGTRIILYCTVA